MTTILCICQRGNVRSATCAAVLRDYGMHADALATGVETTTPETMQLLSDWADVVLICGDDALVESAPPTLKSKNRLWSQLNVGADVWGQPMHPELVGRLIDELKAKTTLLNGPTRWPESIYYGLVVEAHAGIKATNPARDTEVWDLRAHLDDIVRLARSTDQIALDAAYIALRDKCQELVYMTSWWQQDAMTTRDFLKRKAEGSDEMLVIAEGNVRHAYEVKFVGSFIETVDPYNEVAER